LNVYFYASLSENKQSKVDLLKHFFGKFVFFLDRKKRKSESIVI